MKKIFVIQTTVVNTVKEILEDRDRIINVAMQHLGEKVKIINLVDIMYLLYHLCECIKDLSVADVIYLCKGWEEHINCRILHQCAIEYGIDIIEE